MLLYLSNQICTPGVDEKPGLVAWPPDLMAKGTRRLPITLICGAHSQSCRSEARDNNSRSVQQLPRRLLILRSTRKQKAGRKIQTSDGEQGDSRNPLCFRSESCILTSCTGLFMAYAGIQPYWLVKLRIVFLRRHQGSQRYRSWRAPLRKTARRL